MGDGVFVHRQGSSRIVLLSINIHDSANNENGVTLANFGCILFRNGNGVLLVRRVF